MKNIKKKKGFSLIEILLALAITIVIAVSAFYIYKKVKTESVGHEAVNNLVMITTGLKDIFRSNANHVDYTKFQNDELIPVIQNFAGNDMKLSERGVKRFVDKNGVSYNVQINNFNGSATISTDLFFNSAEDCLAVGKVLIRSPLDYYLVGGDGGTIYTSGDVNSLKGNIFQYSVKKATPQVLAELCNGDNSYYEGIYNGTLSIVSGL